MMMHSFAKPINTRTNLNMWFAQDIWREEKPDYFLIYSNQSLLPKLTFQRVSLTWRCRTVVERRDRPVLASASTSCSAPFPFWNSYFHRRAELKICLINWLKEKKVCTEHKLLTLSNYGYQKDANLKGTKVRKTWITEKKVKFI